MAFTYTDIVFRQFSLTTGVCPFCDEFCQGNDRKSKKNLKEHFESAHKFGHVEKAVLLSLAEHANDKTGLVWAGYTLLSDETLLSRGSVSNAVNRLLALRIISAVDNPRVRSGTYKMNFGKSEGAVRMNGKTYTRIPASSGDEEDELPSTHVVKSDLSQRA